MAALLTIFPRSPRMNIYAFYFAMLFGICSAAVPNILFILTDDQDLTLGGQTPMTKAKELIGDKGMTFENMFVTSPLCCPSRSSILTGKYVHNHRALNNSLDGNCSSRYFQQHQEPEAFPVYLKTKKYNTFLAGKYLNQYGDLSVGGVRHVPPGWDAWVGLVGNSVYYNYVLSVNGQRQRHFDNYTEDYLTDVIRNDAILWLLNRKTKSYPFFMMLSTPACHAPFTPAPQYSKQFADQKAPRTPSYNTHAKNKHWLLDQAITPMPNDTVDTVDDIFRNRWRTLLSVDDLVAGLVNVLTRLKVLDNTYIFFTSDNGYHLGQFSLPNDKRQLYEFDIRVPFMVRGPGIAANQTVKEIVSTVDLAPTFLDLANVTVPEHMDGQSMKKMLHGNQRGTFREAVLVEHSGEHEDSINGCPNLLNQGMDNCDNHCVCEDSWNNTFSCVRTMTESTNYKYCEIQDRDHFIEFYDLSKDPDELNNIWRETDPKLLDRMSTYLIELATCKGKECRDVNVRLQT